MMIFDANDALRSTCDCGGFVDAILALATMKSDLTDDGIDHRVEHDSLILEKP